MNIAIIPNAPHIDLQNEKTASFCAPSMAHGLAHTFQTRPVTVDTKSWNFLGNWEMKEARIHWTKEVLPIPRVLTRGGVMRNELHCKALQTSMAERAGFESAANRAHPQCLRGAGHCNPQNSPQYADAYRHSETQPGTSVDFRDLQVLTDAWPTLNHEIKSALMSIIRMATNLSKESHKQS